MAILGFGLVAIGLVINMLSMAFAAGRLFRRPKSVSHSRVTTTLILPLSGRAETLETIVRLLESQSHPARRLIVAVESQSDPAFARARAVAASSTLPVEVVVAGLAQTQAQKCRNQQAALDLIDDEDAAVVLMDGDILPTPHWLRALVSPIADGAADIVTGLRWQQISRPSLGAHLVCMIDRAAFVLPRFKARISSVVWGGSVAVSRRALVAMQIGRSLERTLSDDLSLVEAARAAGLRILTDSTLLVPTPAAHSLAEAWRFACRQYRIIHIYRPWLWRLALATIGARLCAWGFILIHVLANGGWVWAAALMAALAVLKPYFVGEVGRRYGLPDTFAVFAVQTLLGLVQPLVDIFHFSAIAAAGWTRRIVWGHVAYRIAGPYSITVESRRPADGAAA